jgi:P27 family predicted phage terminase small subunit
MPTALTNQPTDGPKSEAAGPSRPASEMLECPPELCAVARAEWNRIVGELIALSILSKFDRGPLAIYCQAYAMWLEASQAIEKYGMMIKSPNGHPMQSPYVSVLTKQAEIMLRIASDFGFTPASRHRNFTYSKSNSLLLEADRASEDMNFGMEPLTL